MLLVRRGYYNADVVHDGGYSVIYLLPLPDVQHQLLMFRVRESKSLVNRVVNLLDRVLNVLLLLDELLKFLNLLVEALDILDDLGFWRNRCDWA